MNFSGNESLNQAIVFFLDELLKLYLLDAQGQPLLLTKEQNLLNCLLVLVLDRELECFDKESANGTQIIANSEGSLKVDRECLR